MINWISRAGRGQAPVLLKVTQLYQRKLPVPRKTPVTASVGDDFEIPNPKSAPG